MSVPMYGDSYGDFIIKGKPSKALKTGFCVECGVEIPSDEGPYCVACDHVYQEVQEEQR